MSKKDKMWISCCGCRKPINVPETTKLIEASPFSITWKSVCPYCGFTHRVILMSSEVRK